MAIMMLIIGLLLFFIAMLVGARFFLKTLLKIVGYNYLAKGLLYGVSLIFHSRIHMNADLLAFICMMAYVAVHRVELIGAVLIGLEKIKRGY